MSCSIAADCFGLGDCINGRCACDPYASAAPDCSAFATLPIDWDAAGYRNETSPSWGGTFLQVDGAWHGFAGSMTPGYANRTHDFKEPLIAHVVSVDAGGPYTAVADPIRDQFRADMNQLPTGEFVLFSEARGFGAPGLVAGLVSSLDQLGALRMQPVLLMGNESAAYPWLCSPMGWTATVLPDGSVIGAFRNGGHHCANGSYPGWPNELIGLVRAPCWNCSYKMLTTHSPLFSSRVNLSIPHTGNEDMHLWWSHRGIHMLIHSQNATPPYPVAVQHAVRGVVAFSPDPHASPDSWVVASTPCYNGTIALRNGSVLHAGRRQRPSLVFPPTDASAWAAARRGVAGWPRRPAPTHLANAVDLTYAVNEAGWGDGWTLVQPLKAETLAARPSLQLCSSPQQQDYGELFAEGSAAWPKLRRRLDSIKFFIGSVEGLNGTVAGGLPQIARFFATSGIGVDFEAGGLRGFDCDGAHYAQTTLTKLKPLLDELAPAYAAAGVADPTFHITFDGPFAHALHQDTKICPYTWAQAVEQVKANVEKTKELIAAQYGQHGLRVAFRWNEPAPWYHVGACAGSDQCKPGCDCYPAYKNGTVKDFGDLLRLVQPAIFRTHNLLSARLMLLTRNEFASRCRSIWCRTRRSASRDSTSTARAATTRRRGDTRSSAR
jgi:hypothetical protein